jgi:DNA-binding transcriptional LysR family regulator
LARQKPKLSLNFFVAPRANLIEAIVDRRVHACFACPPAVDAPEVRIDHLATEPLLLAVNRGHRLAGRDRIDLTELASEPLVLCERHWSPEIYDAVMSSCQKAGFSPHVIYHAPQEVCALLLASAGIAATIVPASARRAHSDNLHFATLADGTLSISLALITRADEHVASVRLLRKRAVAIAASTTAAQAG